MFTQGTAFLAGGELHGKHHLWIVINDPRAHAGTALIVNLTSWSYVAEATCVLGPGDHPFIKHRSSVRFASARAPQTSQLNAAWRQGSFVLKERASEELIRRIRQGARTSPHFPPRLLALL